MTRDHRDTSLSPPPKNNLAVIVTRVNNLINQLQNRHHRIRPLSTKDWNRSSNKNQTNESYHVEGVPALKTSTNTESMNLNNHQRRTPSISIIARHNHHPVGSPPVYYLHRVNFLSSAQNLHLVKSVVAASSEKPPPPFHPYRGPIPTRTHARTYARTPSCNPTRITRRGCSCNPRPSLFQDGQVERVGIGPW